MGRNLTPKSFTLGKRISRPDDATAKADFLFYGIRNLTAEGAENAETRVNWEKRKGLAGPIAVHAPQAPKNT